jgi:hypothetical protein
LQAQGPELKFPVLPKKKKIVIITIIINQTDLAHCRVADI